ncbi:MAG: hypothetical protein IJ748_02545 [Bacteroidales bacterium]|nr:hypothetical protein [Bacteroidales bacterium]
MYIFAKNIYLSYTLFNIVSKFYFLQITTKEDNEINPQKSKIFKDNKSKFPNKVKDNTAWPKKELSRYEMRLKILFTELRRTLSAKANVLFT